MDLPASDRTLGDHRGDEVGEHIILELVGPSVAVRGHTGVTWSGRGKPRWSVLGQLALGTKSMAGLPGSRAMVWVGPPLFCSRWGRG